VNRTQPFGLRGASRGIQLRSWNDHDQVRYPVISKASRDNIMAMQIIIMGMHRSGNSLAAQLLHTLGAYAGGEEDLLPATEDNQKGYLERQDVVDLNEYVLNGAGNKKESRGHALSP